MKYRYQILCIRIRFYDRLAAIYLKKYGDLVKLSIAAKLLRAANRICPTMMHKYDEAVIENYFQTGKVGIRFHG